MSDVDFGTWRTARMVRDPAVLGGAAIFKGTRLSVMRVGTALERGETLDAIREDYPYLTAEDLHFARQYARDYPPSGIA